MFHFADQIVILEKGRITNQGIGEDLTNDDIQETPQINLNQVRHLTTEEQYLVLNPTQAQRQNLKVAEAISDLRRSTGDLSLYGDV